MSLFSSTSSKPLAALVFGPEEDANGVVADFAHDLAEQGYRLGGMIQVAAGAENCDCRDTHVLDLETNLTRSILQDLGRHSQSCRIDPAALAEVGQAISAAIARQPELLFINRFGKLEAESKGLFAEIGAAVAAGVPTLVCVSTRYLEPWRQFSMGLDDELACAGEDLRRWWLGLRVKAPAETCLV